MRTFQALHTLACICAAVVVLPMSVALGQAAPEPTATVPAAAPAPSTDKPLLKPEELEQLVAPIALYPDALVTQMLMASTYPLEVVQADRWAKANTSLKGDALASALEKQTWDPSVKSLINFPDILSNMSEKIDITIKLGDAFIEQQADVLNTIQKLRAKAQAAGNLKSNEQLKVVVEPAPAPDPQTIVVQQVPAPTQVIQIQSTSPEVIYVPTYNPTVVYGAWPYPAYPPYPYYPPYPPGYVASSALWFGAGVACGLAWGYAWGNCNWGHSNVNVNINQNVNFNRNINRNNYQNNFNRNGNWNGGQGNWQHNPTHRQGVPYRDSRTAQQFGGANQSARATEARDAYRGRADAGRQEINRGDISGGRNGVAPTQRPAGGAQDRVGAGQNRPNTAAGAQNRPSGSGVGSGAGQNRPSTMPSQNRSSGVGQNRSGSSGSSGGAFNGAGGSGSSARTASQRGQSSRGSAGGGASRGGGGASRGGGGRR